MDLPEQPPQITIHCSEDASLSFEWEPTEEMWLDMRAFCEVTGLTVEELINHALEEFLPP